MDEDASPVKIDVASLQKSLFAGPKGINILTLAPGQAPPRFRKPIVPNNETEDVPSIKNESGVNENSPDRNERQNDDSQDKDKSSKVMLQSVCKRRVKKQGARPPSRAFRKSLCLLDTEENVFSLEHLENSFADTDSLTNKESNEKNDSKFTEEEKEKFQKLLEDLNVKESMSVEDEKKATEESSMTYVENTVCFDHTEVQSSQFTVTSSRMKVIESTNVDDDKLVTKRKSIESEEATIKTRFNSSNNREVKEKESDVQTFPAKASNLEEKQPSIQRKIEDDDQLFSSNKEYASEEKNPEPKSSRRHTELDSTKTERLALNGIKDEQPSESSERKYSLKEELRSSLTNAESKSTKTERLALNKNENNKSKDQEKKGDSSNNAVKQWIKPRVKPPTSEIQKNEEGIKEEISISRKNLDGDLYMSRSALLTKSKASNDATPYSTSKTKYSASEKYSSDNKKSNYSSYKYTSDDSKSTYSPTRSYSNDSDLKSTYSAARRYSPSNSSYSSSSRDYTSKRSTDYKTPLYKSSSSSSSYNSSSSSSIDYSAKSHKSLASSRTSASSYTQSSTSFSSKIKDRFTRPRHTLSTRVEEKPNTSSLSGRIIGKVRNRSDPDETRRTLSSRLTSWTRR